VTEANSKAAAAPAAIPISTICIITSCPAPHRAVRDGHAAPTIGSRASPQASFELPYHIRQQAEEARTFDRLRQLTLLLGRHRGDAARHDLAALRHVALQQLDVLVVDLRRIGARERTGLAPAEERPAATTTTTATATL